MQKTPWDDTISLTQRANAVLHRIQARKSEHSDKRSNPNSGITSSASKATSSTSKATSSAATVAGPTGPPGATMPAFPNRLSSNNSASRGSRIPPPPGKPVFSARTAQNLRAGAPAKAAKGVAQKHGKAAQQCPAIQGPGFEELQELHDEPIRRSYTLRKDELEELPGPQAGGDVYGVSGHAAAQKSPTKSPERRDQSANVSRAEVERAVTVPVDTSSDGDVHSIMQKLLRVGLNDRNAESAGSDEEQDLEMGVHNNNPNNGSFRLDIDEILGTGKRGRQKDIQKPPCDPDDDVLDLYGADCSRADTANISETRRLLLAQYGTTSKVDKDAGANERGAHAPCAHAPVPAPDVASLESEIEQKKLSLHQDLQRLERKKRENSLAKVRKKIQDTYALHERKIQHELTSKLADNLTRMRAAFEPANEKYLTLVSGIDRKTAELQSLRKNIVNRKALLEKSYVEAQRRCREEHDVCLEREKAKVRDRLQLEMAVVMRKIEGTVGM